MRVFTKGLYETIYIFASIRCYIANQDFYRICMQGGEMNYPIFCLTNDN